MLPSVHGKLDIDVVSSIQSKKQNLSLKQSLAIGDFGIAAIS